MTPRFMTVLFLRFIFPLHFALEALVSLPSPNGGGDVDWLRFWASLSLVGVCFMLDVPARRAPLSVQR